VKRIYHTFLGSGAVMVGALAAVLIVNGGWQAIAAALATLAGLGLGLSFISLAAVGERPPATRPAWARATPAGPARRPTPAPAAERRTARPGRAARGRLSSAPS
jgi:hypothetical protein